MTTTTQKWTARVLRSIAVLFLLMDATMKVLQSPIAVEGTKKLGYPVTMILPLGIIQLIAIALYLFPRTSVLGAIIFTGYLGGAVTTHVRMSDPLFSHILFPTYVAALLWLGIWLRDQRLRALLPIGGAQ